MDYGKKIFEFYTLKGALALREHLKSWQGGDFVVSVADVPYKCPVAPLEYVFLADEYFTKIGIRNKVSIKYVTPFSGAFTKPKATRMLSELLGEKNIEVISDFYLERVDNVNQKLIAYDGRELNFDLLSIVPVNKGDDLIAQSEMGDDLNFVPTNQYTLQSLHFENVFVIGDASNIPTSKAGFAAHFSWEILFENIMSYIKGRPLNSKFD